MYVVFREDEEKISDSTVLVLYGVFTGVTVLGMLLLACLRLAPKQGVSEVSPALPAPSDDEPQLTETQRFREFHPGRRLISSFHLQNRAREEDDVHDGGVHVHGSFAQLLVWRLSHVHWVHEAAGPQQQAAAGAERRVRGPGPDRG